MTQGYFSSTGTFPASITYIVSATFDDTLLANSPIGSIVGWLKSYTSNATSLPEGWKECDGSILTDERSVFDGQTLPNLNDGYFFKGNSTSGTTTVGTHTHTDSTQTSGALADGSHSADSTGGSGQYTLQRHTHQTKIHFGATAVLPPYYDVVYIIRIR